MRKKFAVGIALLGLLAIPVGVAHALRVAPAPGPIRFANAEAVFVGKVLEFEPVDVDAKPYPDAKETVKYRVAIVKINQAIHGLKNEKTIRVGYIPFMPKKGVPIISPGGRGPQLQAGQEGLFIISKHPDGKFYLAPNFGYFVPSTDKNQLEKDIKSAKQVLTVMKDIKGSLQSKDGETRLTAAAIQVSRYRTQKPPFPNKEQPIDAEESKLILNAIANAKWGAFKFGEVNPQQLFFQLGINANDGYNAPKKITGPNDLQNSIQDWLKANAGTYRIKRFVSAPTK